MNISAFSFSVDFSRNNKNLIKKLDLVSLQHIIVCMYHISIMTIQ